MLILLAVVLFAGCVPVGPNYRPPEDQLADKWEETSRKNHPFLVPTQGQIKEWWKVFGDPVLYDLIKEGGAGNYDVRLALARLDEAKASLGVTTGEIYPQISMPSSITRQRVGENGQPPNGQDVTNYSSGFAASWEIDLFGRIRRSIEASEADYQAGEEDLTGVLIAIYAETARTYIAIRTAQARLATTEQNIKSQKEIVELTRSRFEFGLASDLEVAQSEQVLAESEAAVPQIRTNLDNNIYALSLLLGKPPGALRRKLSQVKPIPDPSDNTAVGVPADLIRRRPDIRGAERQLAAQTARIGVATANLYPSLTLSGLIGLASISSGNFFTAGSKTYQLGADLGWTLFSGGSLRSQVKVEDARAKQALLTYEQTVLNAWNEVEQAIVTYAENRNRRAALEHSVEVAQRTLKLSLELYKDGLQNFQSTLDAERTLFDAENNAADAEGDVASSLVSLYEALGGGWDPDQMSYMHETIITE